MLRVAVVSSVHRWNDTRVFRREATSLAREGYTVTLVAVGNQKEPFRTSGLVVYPLRRRKRYLRWLAWLAILRLVFKLDASVVHMHDPELFMLVPLLRLAGRKVVCDVHEDIADQVLHKEWLAASLRRPLSKILSKMQRNLPRLADAVILAEEAYRTSFPGGADLCVIHNFPLLPSTSKQTYQTPVLRLVYVGDVRIVRGIREYISLLHSLRLAEIDAELRIVGSFADQGEKIQMEALVSTLHLQERVAFLGRRPPEEIPGLLEQCDIGLALLHPIRNYRDSYPTKMFEYMASGLPVVASRFPLWEEVLVHNDCGRVVDPLDVEAATAVVREYWRSTALRERHGRNGRRAVEERYHWDLEVPKLRAVYRTLGASPTGKGALTS